MIRTALYRWFDEQGGLLYVGISFNPVARAAMHSRGQPWWSQIRYCSRGDVIRKLVREGLAARRQKEIQS